MENVLGGGFRRRMAKATSMKNAFVFLDLNFTAPGNGPQTRLGHKLLGAGQRLQNYTVKHTASASEA